MKTKHSEHTLHIVIAAMFAAMIAVMTAFVQIKTPTQGYVHLGDSMIYLVACFLPMPYAVAAAAIGGGIADLITGYADVAVYTVIIKALNAVFFTSKKEKILTKRNALMTIPSGLVTVVGYSISKLIRMLLAGNEFGISAITALWKMPENAIQALASALVFILIAAAFDKADIKHRMIGKK